MAIIPDNGVRVSESPEELERKAELDREFERRGQEADFNTGAKELRESLGYRPFTPPEETQESEELTTQLESTELEGIAGNEGLYTPRINDFVGRSFLSPEEGEEVIMVLAESSDIEAIRNTSLSEEKQEQCIAALEYMNNPENREEFMQDFERSFGDELGYTDMTESQQILFKHIGSYYCILEGGSADDVLQQQAFDTAIETALNEVLGEVQVHRNESFMTLNRQIRDTTRTVRERFEDFDQLLSIISTDQGMKGGRKALDALLRGKKMRATEAKEHEVFIAGKQEQTEDQRENRGERDDEILAENGQDIRGGELDIGGGEEDVLGDPLSENPSA